MVKRLFLQPNSGSNFAYSIENTPKLPVSNLHTESFNDFLNPDNLLEIFKSYFPVQSSDNLFFVEAESFDVEPPKLTPEFCRNRSLTYESQVFATFRVGEFSLDPSTGARELVYVKKQRIFLFSSPLVLESGAFIINGVEKIVVPQMHRAPGLFIFSNVMQSSLIYTARIIPYSGSWIDFEIDSKNSINVKIGSRKKINIAHFLSCMGAENNDIVNLFFRRYTLEKSENNEMFFIPGHMFEDFDLSIALFDVFDENQNLLVKSGMRFSNAKKNKVSSEGAFVRFESFMNSFAINDNGSHDLINESFIEEFKSSSQSIQVLFNIGFLPSAIAYSILDDAENFNSNSLSEFFKIMRPGSPFSKEDSEGLIKYMFQDISQYDLSEVGRYRMNNALKINVDSSHRCLTAQDLLGSCFTLMDSKLKSTIFSDLDSMEHRRIKRVGDMLEGILRTSAIKVARVVADKLVTTTDFSSVLPQDLILPSIINSAIKDFFLLSELSHFMDSTNPLSEVSHIRRVTSLGTGGLDRERAGIEVRDVHISHYGKICSVETPEGRNTGLVMSFASQSALNKHGFIITPYRVVKDGMITNEIEYLDYKKEKESVIASYSKDSIKGNMIVGDLVLARKKSEFSFVKVHEISYIDYLPNQILSISSSLVPFIENDDVTRALMGSNMQRQALPLPAPNPPIVGTGFEKTFLQYSDSVVKARHSGIVDFASSNCIIVSYEDESGMPHFDTYDLKKFRRSNHNTIVNQSPVVREGQAVAQGDILTSGQSSDGEELSIGFNALIGFMTWNGYNFEDSIIISDRLANDDNLTSIKIKELTIDVKDTRIGAEEVTTDIPNVSHEKLANLDECGIIKYGSVVEPGDVLVGKVTPKSHNLLTPEEKLLKAIFGERGSDFVDSSLRVPSDVRGSVVGCRILTKRGVPKSKRALLEQQITIKNLEKDKINRLGVVDTIFIRSADSLLNGKKAFMSTRSPDPVLFDDKLLSTTSLDKKLSCNPVDSDVSIKVQSLKASYDEVINNINEKHDNELNLLHFGEQLPKGVITSITISIATTHYLQPGDKLSGRHGNKGVVSKIANIADMPFLKDGTPLDVLLSPLGIAQRMNVGQVLEVHLGLVGWHLGRQIQEMMSEKKALTDIKEYLKKTVTLDSAIDIIDKMDGDQLSDTLISWGKNGVTFAVPSFNAVGANEVQDLLRNVGYSQTGQVDLYDGITGRKFDRKVTIGSMYLLKLHHIVDEKIHSRSVGSYSLINQQPLGGRANFGGQRFGEMECWSLQAYGAAHMLQEMLTVKSDDVVGRSKMYESIIHGDNNFSFNVPESFNVLIKQLRSLCLDIEVMQEVC